MEIRTARATDAEAVTPLMYSAGPEVYDYLYRAGRHTAQDFIRFEFLSGRGFCGHPNVTVAVDGGQVIGSACLVDAAGYEQRVKGTVANLFRFFGPLSVWPVLLRSGHIGSIMRKPEDGELYLSNFGVAPERQGGGVGTRLIEHGFEQARRQGCRTFGLDVADNNPHAQRLYTRLGLRVVEEKAFTGRRPGFTVPHARKMEAAVSTSPASLPHVHAAPI